MPFLQQQIQLINTQLRAKGLSDARFQSGRYEAIATDVSRVETDRTVIMPAVVDADGQTRYVGVDDTYPIIIYHKVLSNNYAVATSSVGDGNREMRQTALVRMVVYGKRSVLQLSAFELEALIAVNFPDNFSASLLQPYKLSSMHVDLLRSDMNGAEVFAREYKGVDLFISAEDILFSIDYTIESRFTKGCFDCPADLSSGNSYCS